MHLALEELLDGLADAAGTALLVLVVLELALQEERVEGGAIPRRGDVGADDVGTGRGAGAGEHRQEAGVVGREHRQLGHGGEGIGLVAGCERAAVGAGKRGELQVVELALGVGAQPVVVEMARDEMLDRRRLDADGGLRESGLRLDHAIGHAGALLAAIDEGQGLVIERAQELALPSVPGGGADRADVGDGEDQEQLQALGRADDVGEVAARLRVGQIAALGDGAHVEMVEHEPFDEGGLLRVETEARADVP